MPSIAFDRAAEYYDSTRGFAQAVSERIRDAIVATTGANKETRFLELGIGTGRIALPFIRAGYTYTGVDISRPIMEQLARKLAAEDVFAEAMRRLDTWLDTECPNQDRPIATTARFLALVARR